MDRIHGIIPSILSVLSSEFLAAGGLFHEWPQGRRSCDTDPFCAPSAIFAGSSPNAEGLRRPPFFVDNLQTRLYSIISVAEKTKGGVAKRIRRGTANPLFLGSNPSAAFLIILLSVARFGCHFFTTRAADVLPSRQLLMECGSEQLRLCKAPRMLRQSRSLGQLPPGVGVPRTGKQMASYPSDPRRQP